MEATMDTGDALESNVTAPVPAAAAADSAGASSGASEPGASAPAPADTRARGLAPIKTEYLIGRKPRQDDGEKRKEREPEDVSEDSAARASGESVAEASAPTEGAAGGGVAAPMEGTQQQEEQQKEQQDGSEPSKKKQKRKGQFTAAERQKRTIRDQVKLCPYIAKSDPCPFGAKCRFLHDIEVYKKKRLPDLPGECPTWHMQGGNCPYHVTCRYYGTHAPLPVDPDRKVVIYTLTESNSLGHDLMISLRKRKYKFSLWEAHHKTSRSASKVEDPCTLDGLEESEDLPGEPGGACDLEAESALAEPDLVDPAGGEEDEEMEGANIEGGATVTSEPAFPAAEPRTGAHGERERKKIDWNDKIYLAPLTTVGNLPFRRICKRFGVDITVGEMAMAANIVQGHRGEWALLRRHESEDIFGAQIAGSNAGIMARAAEVICKETDLDFIDINCGCPIDLLFRQGAGSALMEKPMRLRDIGLSMSAVMDIPLTIKVRMGVRGNNLVAHKLIKRFPSWGFQLTTIHGRTREQRYSKLADWEYIKKVVDSAAGSIPVYGNGDVLSWEDAVRDREQTGVSGIMVGRGALMKPWIFTEIKERRHWDISAQERFDIMKDFCNFGLLHWGSDTQGVERTRYFLLEWMSFLHRYIPVGLLEVLPQRINDRPPAYFARNDLETMLASSDSDTWVKITEMLLGPPPPDFKFIPKHKANAYGSGPNPAEAQG